MPRPVNVEIRIPNANGRGGTVVGAETRHLMGPAEGVWWYRYSWWVIPVGLLVILLPWLIMGGVFGKRQANYNSAPPVRVIRTVPAPAPPLPVSPPSSPAPSGKLSPEAAAERFWGRAQGR